MQFRKLNISVSNNERGLMQKISKPIKCSRDSGRTTASECQRTEKRWTGKLDSEQNKPRPQCFCVLREQNQCQRCQQGLDKLLHKPEKTLDRSWRHLSQWGHEGTEQSDLHQGKLIPPPPWHTEETEAHSPTLTLISTSLKNISGKSNLSPFQSLRWRVCHRTWHAHALLCPAQKSHCLDLTL